METFLFFVFVFVLFFFFSFKKVLFCCLFYFFGNKTKIRNRKAVFQADSPIKGSRDLAW